jgi:hypothetical protein
MQKGVTVREERKCLMRCYQGRREVRLAVREERKPGDYGGEEKAWPYGKEGSRCKVLIGEVKAYRTRRGGAR